MDSSTVVSCGEPREAAPVLGSPMAAALGRSTAWVRRQWKMSRDTAKLMALDDHLLADMGLSRGEIRGLVRRGR
jgi:uncharacterized protein YjiS (DUF1127 family)